MEELIRVGMAELKTGRAPQKLCTIGLGSCIGFCVFDPVAKVGGLLHIMLPSSKITQEAFNPAKFADTGIPLIIKKILELGAVQERLEFKIAGGAQMFMTEGQNNSILNVGERNVEAVEAICYQNNFKINARSVGGNAGKTITLDLNTGELEVKTLSEGRFLI